MLKFLIKLPFKLLFNLLLIPVIILVLSLYFGRNIITKIAIEQNIKQTTDLNTKIGRVNLDLKNSLIEIESFKIKNPKGFKDAEMLHAPEIFIDIKLLSLFKRTIHIEEARLNIDQLVIIKNENGELNINALAVEDPDSGPAEDEDTEGKKKNPFIKNTQIDLAHLKIRQILYKDYSKGQEPVIKEINVYVDEKVENVSSVEELFAVIAQKAMMKSAISALTGVNVNEVIGIGRDIKELGNQLKELKNIFQPEQ